MNVNRLSKWTRVLFDSQKRVYDIFWRLAGSRLWTSVVKLLHLTFQSGMQMCMWNVCVNNYCDTTRYFS